MASDIKALIQQAQEVVNAGVLTVKETRITQEVLQKNITVTERKIGVHNVDEEAHPDIRARIDMIPVLPNMPLINGPSAVENNFEYSWTLSLDSLEYEVSTYKVALSTGEEFVIPANEDGTGTFTHTFQGEDGTKVSMGVTAIASNNYSSVASVFELTITQHSAPDVSQMTHTFPSVVTHGKTYTWKINNITDVDDDIANITVTSNNAKAVLSQTNNIQQNTEYTLTIDDTLVGPGNMTITVKATDSYGYNNSKTLTLRINQDPTVASITTTIPTRLGANTSNTCRISGVTDPDSDTVTFSITSNNDKITFSKSNNIAMNEDFTINVGDLEEGTAYTLTLKFTDPYGGEVIHTIKSSINKIPVIASMVHTLPDIVYPGQTLTFKISGATDADGDPLTYIIENSNSVLTFGKTSGIAENETVPLTVSSSAIRGRTYNITIATIDNSGGKSSETVGIKINTKPVIANIQCPIETNILPNKTYTFTATGATDVDGQTLTYTYTCSNDGAQITKSGDQITFISPSVSDMPRGTTCNLILTVSDGLEESTKSFTLTMNSVPAGTISHTVPTSMYGGTDNQTTVKFYGATDADNDAITYRLSSINSNLTFSKTTGIIANEELTLTAKKVNTATGCTFKVTAYDDRNEAGVSRTITVTINPIMKTSTPSITYPTADAVVPHEVGFVAWISAYAPYADLS